jgi:hypothetical protein
MIGDQGHTQILNKGSGRKKTNPELKIKTCRRLQRSVDFIILAKRGCSQKKKKKNLKKLRCFADACRQLYPNGWPRNPAGTGKRVTSYSDVIFLD